MLAPCPPSRTVPAVLPPCCWPPCVAPPRRPFCGAHWQVLERCRLAACPAGAGVEGAETGPGRSDVTQKGYQDVASVLHSSRRMLHASVIG